jgi:2-amino-4-hydroxy-6-hydroxymethyldihydropteridine diphosphokinase
MILAYLLLGSNIGNRQENIAHAHQLLNFRCGKIERMSSVYETAAWGKTDQAAFLNQAIELRTKLQEHDLLIALKNIEQRIGREPGEKWGTRLIDIDILFFGNLVLDSDTLNIPHPFLHQRRFTLAPLAELIPSYNHPLLNKTIQELLDQCPDNAVVKKL